VARRVLLVDRLDEAVGHLHHLRVERLAAENRAPLAVDDLALRVHDVVVLEQVLADIEVVRFDLALRVGDGARDQAVFDRLAFLHAEAGHQALDALGAEDAQQVVFERQVEARGARGALATGAAAQLGVDAPALLPPRARDGQAAGIHDLLALDRTELLILVQDVRVAPAQLLGRGFHLLADVFDDLGVLAPVGLVGRARVGDRRLVRRARLAVGALGGLVGRQRLVVRVLRRRAVRTVGRFAEHALGGALVVLAGALERRAGPRQRSARTVGRRLAQRPAKLRQRMLEALLSFFAEV